MISERKFAERFTSFWHDAMPRGAIVSRYINLQKVRFEMPLESSVSAERRALVNEVGFRLFSTWASGGTLEIKAPTTDRLAEIGREVAESLAAELPSLTVGGLPEPSTLETAESTELAGRLADFFLEHAIGEHLIPMPEFAGCGILESCRGDLFAGTTLYEVKSGEGSFRLTDLRQVLIYCALNHALPRYPIRSIGLLNPRKGVFFTADLDSLVRGASGMAADSLFFEMANFWTSQGVSS